MDEKVALSHLVQDAAAVDEAASAPSEPLDAHVDRRVRLAIERGYYERINALGDLNEILKDRSFLADPVGHPALFADHGVAHARDVARQILQVLDAVHGRLIPSRDAARLQWMKAYGVLVALLHDIGMVDPSPMGRAMHPEYAVQAVLGDGFDPVLADICAGDRGGLASRVAGLQAAGALGGQPAETVLREMLAMAKCHSKRKVPVALLNDVAGLRRAMQVAAAHDLERLYRWQRGGEGAPAAGEAGGFAWLEAGSAAGREIVADAIDTLRALRCADALRQRGTLLKTSGQYEIFVDERTANAVYAFRPDEEHLYLLEINDPISAGESNLAGSQLDAGANLRVSFYHGRFQDEATIRKAAASAARVLNSIQGDAIGSFERTDGAAHPELARAADLRILIEAPDDNPAFAGLVREELAKLNATAAGRADIVPSLTAASVLERGRYLGGNELEWDAARRRELLARVALCGHRTERIDPDAAFAGVRLIELKAGETLIEAETPSGFVYLPLAKGLRGRPLGGYEDFAIGPWVLVGVTGVIRGAKRNADIFAECDLTLLAIPKGVFIDHWHFTYDREAFAALFSPGA